MQQINANSGLTDNTRADITIGTAVSGITKLRDNLAGTAAENALTRNTVAVGSTTSTTGPDLFAADSDAIAFTRTPSQVTLSFPNPPYACTKMLPVCARFMPKHCNLSSMHV